MYNAFYLKTFLLFMKVKTRKVLTFAVKTLKNHTTNSTCALETTFFSFKKSIESAKGQDKSSGKNKFQKVLLT